MKARLLLGILGATALLAGCERNPVEADCRYTWEVSAPEAQGLDSRVLDSALAQAESAGFIDGLLIIRNGFIVAEEYFNEYDEFRPHNAMSVSKSFLSAITGIALHCGYIDSLEERVLSYFPEYVHEGMDPRKHDITIRHLLTMRMGIRGEAEDDYGVYMGLYNSDNWIKATLESPLVFRPGESIRYNTFETHLLSAIITKATGRSTRDFARKCVLDCMRIDVDAWERDPQGYYFGGNSMYFTPREMAVLGLVYLNGGRLNGFQVVPSSWVKLTLSPSTDFTHPNAWGALRDYNYAYLWWLGRINEYKLFMGYGYGGQFVVVFPELNVIVVSTAEHRVSPEVSTVQEWALFDLIAQYILPSVRS